MARPLMTFAQMIDRWGLLTECVADIRAASGVHVNYETVRKWRDRNSIPIEHWPMFVAAAKRRGYTDITTDALLAAATRSRRRHSQKAA